VKQVVDVSLFVGGIYFMCHYGKETADKFESVWPSEKNVMDLMKQMNEEGGYQG